MDPDKLEQDAKKLAKQAELIKTDAKKIQADKNAEVTTEQAKNDGPAIPGLF